MRIILYKCLFTLIVLSFTACDKKNTDLVNPLTANEFPQVITFSDEGDGEIEDEDKFSCKLTLNKRVDPSGKELRGKVVPLTQDVTVAFEVTNFEGFAALPNYVKSVAAFFEQDDCAITNVTVAFNATTGKGTVIFPKGAEEIEIEFKTDANLFADNVINTAERNITLKITNVTGGKYITFNTTAEFKYNVLDDDAIHGDWKIDHNDSTEFTAFKTLFGLINDEVKNLNASAVKDIKFSIEYDEVKVKIKLKATENITECGATAVQNKTIEIEANLEEVTIGKSRGDIEFADELEQTTGSLKEFMYKGKFTITENYRMKISLHGQYNETTTPDIILNLKK